MKKILVPTDFSKPAANALDFALDIASKSHGAVHMIHVIELPVLHDTVLMPTLNFEEALLKELRDKAQQSFSKLIAKHNAAGIKVSSEILFGSVMAKTLEYIRIKEIDLVVVGSHGTEGIREIFIGSNAEKIVRKSTVPVLVVKKFFKGPIKNIVFPVSFTTEDQEALALKIKSIQQFFKAHLHIVWINTPINFMSDVATNKLLNEYTKQYKFQDYTTSIFNAVDVEDGVLDFAKSIHGDLIAMGTHGRTGFQHFVNRSLTEDVVNHYNGLIWTYSYKNDPKPVV